MERATGNWKTWNYLLDLVSVFKKLFGEISSSNRFRQLEMITIQQILNANGCITLTWNWIKLQHMFIETSVKE